jgi:hypothetical protein
MTEMPSIGNGTQHCENKRKNSFLNYESPALTAELQAQVVHILEHNISMWRAKPISRRLSRRKNPTSPKVQTIASIFPSHIL